MPETRTFVVHDARVEVAIHRGREYDRRVELCCDDVELVYGVDADHGRIVADFLALYQHGELAAVGADAEQPAWADTVLNELDITEVQV